MPESVPVHGLIEAIQAGDVVNCAFGKRMLDLEPRFQEDMKQDAKAIAAAHKFDFTGWKQNELYDPALMETAVDLLDAGLMALPFPLTVLCRRSRTLWPNPTCDEVMLIQRWKIKDGREPLGGRLYIRAVARTGWVFAGYTMVLPTSQDYVHWDCDPAPRVPRELQERSEAVAWSFFVCALAALNSHGPVIEHVAAPERLNRARAARGRPPVFEYHSVRLPAPVHARRAPDEDHEHRASPRQHWRRGHVRHLGQDRRTLIRACLVGDPELGRIEKDYAVSPKAVVPGLPLQE